MNWITSVIYHGNVIDRRLSDNYGCRKKRSVLIGNVNKVIGNYSTLKDVTKRKFVGPLCGHTSTRELLYKRTLKFIHAVLNSTISVVAWTG